MLSRLPGGGVATLLHLLGGDVATFLHLLGLGVAVATMLPHCCHTNVKRVFLLRRRRARCQKPKVIPLPPFNIWVSN